MRSNRGMFYAHSNPTAPLRPHLPSHGWVSQLFIPGDPRAQPYLRLIKTLQDEKAFDYSEQWILGEAQCTPVLT